MSQQPDLDDPDLDGDPGLDGAVVSNENPESLPAISRHHRLPSAPCLRLETRQLPAPAGDA